MIKDLLYATPRLGRRFLDISFKECHTKADLSDDNIFFQISVDGKRKQSNKVFGPHSKRKPMETLEEETEPRNKEWFDGCDHRCMVADCGLVFFEPHVLIQHVEKVHGLSLTDYHSTFGRFVSELSWFVCPVPDCGTKVLHQKVTLARHITSVHNLDLDTFKSRYIQNENQPANNGNVLSRGKDDIDETDFDNWSRGRCLFVCSVCLFEVRDSSTFWSHALVEHSKEPDEYKDEFDDPCVEPVNHDCKVCSKVVRHDPSSISKHTTKAHDISIEKYFEKYIRPKVIKTKFSPTKKMGPKSKTQAKPGKLEEIRKALQGRYPGKVTQKGKDDFATYDFFCLFYFDIKVYSKNVLFPTHVGINISCH